ncbi:MAG: beta strand repeat-containing protein, partial [Candidatus Kapaibacterium sp.]
LPNGSIDNVELANSSVNLNYGAGLSGDASVALGGTLNVQNTGVTSASAGTGISVDQATGGITITNSGVTGLTAGNGISLDQSTGNVTVTNSGILSANAGTGINVLNTNGAITIENTGLLSANAGDGITVTTTNGAATIANAGVLSLAGTTNQVNVDQSTGAITLSLPQNIHTDAMPTFDGLTLDNLNTSSTANQIVVSNNGNIESRSFASLFPGGLLPQGSSANSTLRWNGTAWVENSGLTSDGSGNLSTSGNTTVGGNLTVSGANVNLPNGSIDNVELANSSVNLNYGAGLSGDASVALGGTLNVQNTGVTSASAGTGINVSNPNGAITIENTGLLSANAGAGITVTTTNGAATIANAGVLSLAGTANQVNVDQSTGAITLSLPQNIHTDATPTFDGLTLDNLNTSSTANQIVVSNNGNIESRSFASLFPGGLLPQGSSANSTLRWNGTAWVENSGLTSDGSGNLSTLGNTTVGGNLTVSGTNVNLPNGSIDNVELANSSVNVNYGVGLSGDASVALGGTLNVQNTGVTSASAGAGINVSNPNGAITIENTGLLSANAGAGITVTTTNGAATIGNAGVLSLAGTTNQVNVDQSTGAITLSLPQNIHTDATPTFDGLTLDNLNTTSTANQIVVSNNGSIESRSFASLVGNLPLTQNAIFVGNNSNNVSELISTNDPSALLQQNGSGVPTWSSFSSVVTAIADSLGSTIWKTTGNVGTNPSNHFIGTTDNQPLIVRVNNDTALRILPGATPSLVGGNGANSIATGVIGGVIAGGGDGPSPNRVNADFGAIVGGIRHRSNAAFTFIGGGQTNIIDTLANESVIGGGFVNTIDTGASQSVITGGVFQTIGNYARYATIAGGARNRIDSGARISLIAGGQDNLIGKGNYGAAILGGLEDTIRNGSFYATIGGGQKNLIDGAPYAGISSGTNNRVEGSATGAAISGGEGNVIRFSGRWGTISGGRNNTIDSTADYASIGGGQNNNVGGGAWHSRIGGGLNNTISRSAIRTTVSGGEGNRVNFSARWGTISGGKNNTIDSTADYSSIGGGESNYLGRATWHSRIGGGLANRITATSTMSAILGGRANVIDSANNSAIVGGRGLTMKGDNSFGFHANPAGNNDMVVSDPNIALFGNTDLWLASNDGSASKLKFFKQTFGEGPYPGATSYSSFEAAAGQVSNIEYILPDSAGIVGDILSVKSVAGNRISLDWGTGGGAGWSVTGNVGTNPSANFIGTTDDVPLVVRVNNDTVMRYVHDSLSPIIVGGYNGNRVGAGSYGSVIAGGGLDGTQATIPQPNLIGQASSFGVIGGGWANEIGDYTEVATVSGGKGNIIGDSCLNSTISGGRNNSIFDSSTYSVIGGGLVNYIDANLATLAGGHFNFVSGDYGMIGGGYNNRLGAGARLSTIVGGENNNIRDSIVNSFIGGGRENVMYQGGGFSTIGGGDSNRIWNATTHGTIAGGRRNIIQDTTISSTIAGGGINTISRYADYGTIAGGHINGIGFDSDFSSIAGGEQNTIADTSLYSTIGGGNQNYIGPYSNNAVVVGGYKDSIIGNGDFSSILGGLENKIGQDGRMSTVLGGWGLTLTGSRSFGFHGNSFF